MSAVPLRKDIHKHHDPLYIQYLPEDSLLVGPYLLIASREDHGTKMKVIGHFWIKTHDRHDINSWNDPCLKISSGYYFLNAWYEDPAFIVSGSPSPGE